MTLEELPRCGALNADGVTRCAAYPREGEERCWQHGTTRDQRTKARMRLADLVDLAIDRLEDVLKTTQSERTILKAAEIIFDRTGLEAKSASSDAELARAYLTQKLVEAAQARAGVVEGEIVSDSYMPAATDVVDAEVVDDDDGDTLEDLL